MTIMNFQVYGYLLGELRLLKDPHRDEVFIEETGLIIIENNRWRYTHKQMIAIAREIMGE